MARYREYSHEQSLMLPVRLSLQVQPGTFEYTVNYLVDNEIDLSVFELRYCNDETGAPVRIHEVSVTFWAKNGRAKMLGVPGFRPERDGSHD